MAIFAYKFFVASIFLSCVFAGCSTTAYYSTQIDPQITFDKQESLAIYTKETPSITEKKFALLLADAMIENGFKINGFNYESKKNKLLHNFFYGHILFTTYWELHYISHKYNIHTRDLWRQ